MRDFDNMTEEELENATRLAVGTPVPVNWVCQTCMPIVGKAVNVGLPEKRKCECCFKILTCFEVIK